MNKFDRTLRFLGFNVSRRKDSYECHFCGCILPKKEAIVSGWDSESSLRHIHCSRCGKIIARYVKARNK